MTHFAAALARVEDDWSGWEPELSPAADLDALADELLEGADVQPELLLLLVEEDDEWFAIVRWDAPAESLDNPRIYLSDRRVLEHSELARRLLGDALPLPVARGDTDDEAGRPQIEPAGEVDLLADLGTTGDRLVQLTVEEGLLPADALAALAETAGASEALEALRGA